MDLCCKRCLSGQLFFQRIVPLRFLMCLLPTHRCAFKLEGITIPSNVIWLGSTPATPLFYDIKKIKWLQNILAVKGPAEVGELSVVEQGPWGSLKIWAQPV